MQVLPRPAAWREQKHNAMRYNKIIINPFGIIPLTVYLEIPDLSQQFGAEPGQQGRAVVGHIKHHPHPLPLTHHTVNTVEPREVDAPLSWQQNVAGLHPPVTSVEQANKYLLLQKARSDLYILSFSQTGERNPFDEGIPVLSKHRKAGTLSGIHSFHLGNKFSVSCLQSLSEKAGAEMMSWVAHHSVPEDCQDLYN